VFKSWEEMRSLVPAVTCNVCGSKGSQAGCKERRSTFRAPAKEEGLNIKPSLGENLNCIPTWELSVKLNAKRRAGH